MEAHWHKKSKNKMVNKEKSKEKFLRQSFIGGVILENMRDRNLKRLGYEIKRDTLTAMGYDNINTENLRRDYSVLGGDE